MIKKLLSSILITLLFITTVYAANTTVTIDITNNVATITLNDLNENIHALQLDLTTENDNSNVTFTPANHFVYSEIVTKDNTISILIDNGDSLTKNGTLNVGTLTFKDKPKLSKNVKLELVNLNEGVSSDKNSIEATINIKEESTETTTSVSTGISTGGSSGGGGANIGSPSDNNTENTTSSNNTETKPESKPENKPTENIDINTIYPVIRQSNFNDTSNHWANEPITYLADRGIINGKNENTFAPNDNITRAEFITLLAKMDNIDINKHKAENFTDVPANAWYNPYVDWAAKNGITSGITADTFAPNDNITREQMAVMIERFANYKNFSLDSNKEQINFTDNSNISSYASSSVAKVQQAGIINGRPDGSFAPKANATRGESAQMIYTMLTIQ